MSRISTFLQETGSLIPDNTVPDSPVAAKVKRLLMEEFDLSPDTVTNEAELRRDLDLYDLDRLDLLAAWMNAFDIDHRLLDEVMRSDGKGTDILFRVRTVGELVALTEWLVQENRG
jgi:acyl carrier protein